MVICYELEELTEVVGRGGPLLVEVDWGGKVWGRGHGGGWGVSACFFPVSRPVRCKAFGVVGKGYKGPRIGPVACRSGIPNVYKFTVVTSFGSVVIHHLCCPLAQSGEAVAINFLVIEDPPNVGVETLGFAFVRLCFGDGFPSVFRDECPFVEGLGGK